MIFSRLSFLNAASALALLLAGDAAIRGVQAHGGHGGGEQVPEGKFRVTPVITIEGHGGLETNLDGKPEHYAIDGQFGYVFEWGLPNKGVFAIEDSIGPSLVYGEAEHFYGLVHAHGGDDREFIWFHRLTDPGIGLNLAERGTACGSRGGLAYVRRDPKGEASGAMIVAEVGELKQPAGRETEWKQQTINVEATKALKEWVLAS